MSAWLRWKTKKGPQTGKLFSGDVTSSRSRQDFAVININQERSVDQHKSKAEIPIYFPIPTTMPHRGNGGSATEIDL